MLEKGFPPVMKHPRKPGIGEAPTRRTEVRDIFSVGDDEAMCTLQPSHKEDNQSNASREEYAESDGHDNSYFPIQPPDCPCTGGKDTLRED
jgi:hypothetical protein